MNGTEIVVTQRTILYSRGGLDQKWPRLFFCVVYMKIILIPLSTLYLGMPSVDNYLRYRKCQICKESKIHGCF